MRISRLWWIVGGVGENLHGGYQLPHPHHLSDACRSSLRPFLAMPAPARPLLLPLLLSAVLAGAAAGEKGVDGKGSKGGCRASVFILGARKAGTTSMYHYLMAHPDFRPVLGGTLHLRGREMVERVRLAEDGSSERRRDAEAVRPGEGSHGVYSRQADRASLMTVRCLR